MDLDAIVVPAARKPENLDSVLALGQQLDAQLVLLCSRRAEAHAVRARVAEVPGLRCAVVDLATRVDLGFPRFETSTFGEAMIGSHGDLSLKRNLGLVLGRMCGWRTMLFIDDDIRGLTPRLARRAVGALQHDDQRAAGLLAIDYPDNSVVCHARRLGARDQGVFITGSALAIDVNHTDAFFPEVYNEDWFFLAPYLYRREVVQVGTVRQVPYDPFESPLRAAAEEFGDVVAEGLVAQLHVGAPLPPTAPDYWARFLEYRAAFIAEAAAGCRSLDDRTAERAEESLAVSEWTRARLSPEVLADYVLAWQADRLAWARHLAGIRPQRDLPAALAELGLSDPASTSAGHPYRTPSSRHSTE